MRHRHELYLPPSPLHLCQLAPGMGLSCGSQRSAGTEQGQPGSTGSQQATQEKTCSLAVFTGTTGRKTVARTNTTRQYLLPAEQVSRLAYSALGRVGCGQGCSALGAVVEERSVSLNSRGLCDKHSMWPSTPHIQIDWKSSCFLERSRDTFYRVQKHDWVLWLE